MQSRSTRGVTTRDTSVRFRLVWQCEASMQSPHSERKHGRAIST